MLAVDCTTSSCMQISERQLCLIFEGRIGKIRVSFLKLGAEKETEAENVRG